MNRPIRALMIGAHPDDCDFRCGGIALKYSKAGHTVKFLSLCNGDGGHHIMTPEETASRRRKETLAVAQMAGITYDVWEDVHDCELMASLENRKRLTREIRAFNPDIIFCCRPNDYHADHRNCSMLVQDAAYLLIVPHFCPDAPAMKEMPVILHVYDGFQNPPFAADVAIAIDDVLEQKFKLLACHESQMFEWLPYTKGTLDTVPADPEARLDWLHEPRIPRDRPLEADRIDKKLIGSESEYREAVPAAKFRHRLIERYGEERGSKIFFAETFAVSEYGAALTEEKSRELLPF